MPRWWTSPSSSIRTPLRGLSLDDIIPPDSFVWRHIGPRQSDIPSMLAVVRAESVDALIAETLPRGIRSEADLLSCATGCGLSEHAALAEMRDVASRNEVWRSYLGCGYSDCITPPVILRNVLEDPRWYTPYTPYQAEVSQGRLEALLNFQTMVVELTGMEIATASLLDEATAAAEAMALARHIHPGDANAFFVANDCHPQTISVIQGRAEPLGIRIVRGDPDEFQACEPVFGALMQCPATDGRLRDVGRFVQAVHSAGAMAVVAADILSLALLRPPGECGADIVVGSTQRFGVPMGYGGPHAAFLATREVHSRKLPGRIVGVSKDAEGRPGYRLALQTREQHIRRDKATSNICTAQVLLAVVASMYALYHGPEGLRRIAQRVNRLAVGLAQRLSSAGVTIDTEEVFDTLRIQVDTDDKAGIHARCAELKINLRHISTSAIVISLDETTTEQDVSDIFYAVTGKEPTTGGTIESSFTIRQHVLRESPPLKHPIFSMYRSETELMRYMNRLQAKDLSLADSMIPLGSCTMKLNAAAEMIPITWPEFGKMHPFAPAEQAQGYAALFDRLERMLAAITGLPCVSLQPNAGSQGEFAGLLVIRAFHLSCGDAGRSVCLIPQSAHGTNPASAAMVGMRVVVVKCDEDGNVDLADLRSRAAEHSAALAALMVTYPSTHGVFEEGIEEICSIIHEHGGLVYMDGANMNAQVGLCRPGDFGADICHLNLHKTFCIPHGGGGPGMGPICATEQLGPFLPGHPFAQVGGTSAIHPVSAAPWGSAGILPISYAYIRMMGSAGLRYASEMAILNANYLAERLEPHYPVLYRGKNGRVAHECIIDLRPLKVTSGVEVEDVAKRLMDYGFHAPTVSFPVAGTLMIEPTESESMRELDRFCSALIAIRAEITAIAEGKVDRANNPLKRAPHTARQVTATEWDRPYSREQAAFPAAWLDESKYWPPVARIDNVYGDRNIACSCPPLESYEVQAYESR